MTTWADVVIFALAVIGFVLLAERDMLVKAIVLTCPPTS